VAVLEHPDGIYPPVLPSDTQPTLWAGVWTLLAMGLWGALRPVLKRRPSTTPQTTSG
jgi:hypothetical protein